MTDEKWEELIENLERKYQELERFREELEDGAGRGFREVLEFEGPAGPIQVVRESKPLVLEKKEHYSHRAGDTARIEYKFSEKEFSHKVKVFREVDGEWQEMDASSMGF